MDTARNREVSGTDLVINIGLVPRISPCQGCSVLILYYKISS